MVEVIACCESEVIGGRSDRGCEFIGEELVLGGEDEGVVVGGVGMQILDLDVEIVFCLGEDFGP